jgi:hypothetical protein
VIAGRRGSVFDFICQRLPGSRMIGAGRGGTCFRLGAVPGNKRFKQRALTLGSSIDFLPARNGAKGEHLRPCSTGLRTSALRKRHDALNT